MHSRLLHMLCLPAPCHLHIHVALMFMLTADLPCPVVWSGLTHAPAVPPLPLLARPIALVLA